MLSLNTNSANAYCTKLFIISNKLLYKNITAGKEIQWLQQTAHDNLQNALMFTFLLYKWQIAFLQAT